MGGSNPYIETPDVELPRKAYSIHFPTQGVVIHVDPENLPTSGTGLPGSILDIALASGIDIDHACGGVCACSTCHIVIQSGVESCNETSEDEDDQLERAPGLTPRSRLACQCVSDGTSDLVVVVPGWNRNLVRE